MDIATIIVWILRTLLPITIFWMYYKFQNAKTDAEDSSKNKVSRAALLAYRKSAKGLAPHPGLPQMVSEATAPALFKCSEGRPSKTELSAKKQKQSARQSSDPEFLLPLVNFMALNRNEQQQMFFSTMDSAKANAEARKILMGATHLKRLGVAIDVYTQLRASLVQVEEKTFSRMIEACIRVSDLKDAGTLLMEMESAGFRPADSLVDKVMELYQKQYVSDPAKARLSSEALPFVPAFPPSARSRSASPDVDVACPAPGDRSRSPGQRTALNPTARPFQIFTPKADQTQHRTPSPVSENRQRTALSTMAAPFNPNVNSKHQRTALSAMALPFSAMA